MQMLKQTGVNNFQGGRKNWGGVGQGPISVIKKFNGHKKNYISPYSLKAINKMTNH